MTATRPTRTTRHTRVGLLALTSGAAVASAVSAVVLGASPASAVAEPARFTSAYTVSATPDAVYDADGQPVPGEPGASGTATLRVNSELDVICWDVTVRGVEGPLEGDLSGMRIREAPAGFDGPSRLAVPDPEGDTARRTGSGCAQGPFVSGVEGPDGEDTGAEFTLADLEANPAAYSWDVRTAAFPQGAIRGQLVRVPVGGLETGLGGAQPDAAATVRTVGALGSGAVVLAAAVVLVRRQRPRE